MNVLTTTLLPLRCGARVDRNRRGCDALGFGGAACMCSSRRSHPTGAMRSALVARPLPVARASRHIEVLLNEWVLDTARATANGARDGAARAQRHTRRAHHDAYHDAHDDAHHEPAVRLAYLPAPLPVCRVPVGMDTAAFLRRWGGQPSARSAWQKRQGDRWSEALEQLMPRGGRYPSCYEEPGPSRPTRCPGLFQVMQAVLNRHTLV